MLPIFFSAKKFDSQGTPLFVIVINYYVFLKESDHDLEITVKLQIRHSIKSE